jgi:hypothetical protein
MELMAGMSTQQQQWMTRVAHTPRYAAVLTAQQGTLLLHSSNKVSGQHQLLPCNTQWANMDFKHYSMNLFSVISSLCSSSMLIQHMCRCLEKPAPTARARRPSICCNAGAAVHWQDSSSSSTAAFAALGNAGPADAPAGSRAPPWSPALLPCQDDHLLLRQPAYVAALPAPPRLSEQGKEHQAQHEGKHEQLVPSWWYGVVWCGWGHELSGSC